MELGTIFKENEYTEAYQYAEACGYLIEAIDNEHFKIVEKPVIVQPEPTYAELRQQEYPPIEEQLDMIYWDKVNGTNNWADLITEIKEKYPKPVEPEKSVESVEPVSSDPISSLSEDVLIPESLKENSLPV